MIKTVVKGIGLPYVKVGEGGRLMPFAIVNFPNGEREPMTVSLMHRDGYPLDDGGQIKKIAQEISDAGLDIIADVSIQSSVFTSQELAVAGGTFQTKERKSENV